MKGLRRSFQFIPGNNPAMVQSADILGADSVIFDLEDAVAITEKDSAANLLIEALGSFPYDNIEVVVRINPPETDFGKKDIKKLKGAHVDAILVPKATVEQIKILLPLIDEIGYKGSVICLVETAMGVEEVFEIINMDERIDGVLLGGEDLTADLGVVRTKEGNEINYARSRVVSACKAKKITCIDTPFTDADDLEGLRKDTEYGKSLGFTSKSSINPRHLSIIHEVFSPKTKEIKYALRVMEAVDIATKEGKGVFAIDGKMIDAPVINRAKATINVATQLGLVKDGEIVE